MNPWYFVSVIGSPTGWMMMSIILLVFYILMKRILWEGQEKYRKILKRFLVLFLVSLWVTFGVTAALKTIMDVPRVCIPCPGEGCNPYCPPDSSFPSGHTSTAFALFTSLYVVAGRKRFLPIFIVPALVGIARVMLGVHTVADIIGGAVLGIALVVLMWWVERKELKILK